MSCFWIFIGLNFISKLHGYSDGNFPEACDSMRPLHGTGGAETPPETSEPPFMLSYQLGHNIGDPITVFLERKDASTFRGFMLEARNLNSDGDGPPLGKFIILDNKESRLLKCNNAEGSAVSNSLNGRKTSIKVNWTAEGEELDIIFRATFLQIYSKYWELTVPVLRATSTTTLQATPTTTTEESTTKPVITTMEMDTTQDTHNTLSPTATITNSTTKPQKSSRTEPVDITLMSLNSAVVEMKMQILNVFMAVHPTTSFSHCLTKTFRIAGTSLSVALSVSTLIVLYIYNSFKVKFIVLVCAAMAIGVFEWVIAVLPFGPSHELNASRDIVLRVCFPLHHIVINVFLYFRVISLTEEWGGTRKQFWPLIVHTVLVFLTVVWDIVLCAKKRALQQKVKDKAKRSQYGQGTKECIPVQVFVTLISATLMVLIPALSAVIIVEMFQMWNNNLQ